MTMRLMMVLFTISCFFFIFKYNKDGHLNVVSKLAANITFACFKCSGSSCLPNMMENKDELEKVLCKPNEICWV